MDGGGGAPPCRAPYAQDLRLLRAMRARWVAPVLHDPYSACESWEVLQERWRIS